MSPPPRRKICVGWWAILTLYATSPLWGVANFELIVFALPKIVNKVRRNEKRGEKIISFASLLLYFLLLPIIWLLCCIKLCVRWLSDILDRTA